MVAASFVLLAFAALMALGNWSCIVVGLRGRRAPSLVPFVGGVASIAGVALMPALSMYWAAVFVAADPGVGLMVVALVHALCDASDPPPPVPPARVVNR